MKITKTQDNSFFIKLKSGGYLEIWFEEDKNDIEWVYSPKNERGSHAGSDFGDLNKLIEDE